jgi:hypothetical protein
MCTRTPFDTLLVRSTRGSGGNWTRRRTNRGLCGRRRWSHDTHASVFLTYL